jgi:hypothetical protein
LIRLFETLGIDKSFAQPGSALPRNCGPNSHFEAAGVALFQRVCELDLEGIVAKQKFGPYVTEREHSTWFKILNRENSQKDGREELFERDRRSEPVAGWHSCVLKLPWTQGKEVHANASGLSQGCVSLCGIGRTEPLRFPKLDIKPSSWDSTFLGARLCKLLVLIAVHLFESLNAECRELPSAHAISLLSPRTQLLCDSGKVTTSGRVVVSADGKSRTVTTSGTDPQGKKFKSTAVYDKQ